MTTEANTATAEQPVEATNGATKIDKGWGFLELNELTGDKNKGFTFFVTQYKTLDSFLEQMQRLNKDGKDIALSLINSAVSFKMRNKAANQLVDLEKTAIDSLREKGEILLIDEDEAEKYVPGVRDVDSVSGLTREVEKLKKAILEEKKKPTPDNSLIETYRAQAKETLVRLNEKLAEALMD